jgi:hypothetical protein
MDDRWAQYLTGTMREIADVIGMDGALALWSGLKYQQIWIPRDWRRNKQLVELLGEKKTQQITTHFGSEYIYVPGEAIEDFLLADRVLAFDREGISTVQISKQMGITRTRVYLLRKKFAGANEWASEAFVESRADGQTSPKLSTPKLSQGLD